MRPIQAVKDDLLPLSVPLETETGELVDTVFVRKGQWAKLPIECISRSEALWGPDAKVFNPARWLEEGRGVGQYRARELQGYRHLLTFSDGPRICLGKVCRVVSCLSGCLDAQFDTLPRLAGVCIDRVQGRPLCLVAQLRL
jgi:cytochrome P450